jgi:thiamine-phosphate diphosphorylase
VSGVRFDPGLMLVTDEAACAGRGVVETVREAVHGGVTAVQVRDKEADAADVLALVVRVAEACEGRAAVLVNDRVDVFLAARSLGAPVAGVHVGQSDLPVASVRTIVGPDAVVGLSAETPTHLAAVDALPPGTVTYLGVGVVRSTETKPDHPPPLGVAGFAGVAAASALPCVAIGGIRVEDVAPALAAGGAGVAVASAICAAPDARAAARRFSQEVDRARAC